MMTKRLALAASVLIFTAISGQAFAGETMSDQRYWPEETHASTVTTIPSASNAFARMSPDEQQAMEPQQATDHPQYTYHGGPKSDY